MRSSSAAILGLGLSLAGGTVADATSPQPAAPEAGGDKAPPPSPEERMARRFPQPIEVRRLIGASLLDGTDNILGLIKSVARTPEGKLVLVIGYGGFLGFGQRLVPVPIEVVAWLGPAVVAMDWEVDQFELAPTWYEPKGSAVLGAGEIIRIAITRR